jgi:hypothetical protein
MKSPRRMPGTGTGVPVPVPGILLGEEKAAIRSASVSHGVISQQKGVSAAALLNT